MSARRYQFHFEVVFWQELKGLDKVDVEALEEQVKRGLYEAVPDMPVDLVSVELLEITRHKET